ncbi:cytochrome P450 [Sparassis crispa]|uniref:Cytochrome P450 n=1 Tax=Sparassis crispa TaxID=139825 RepID=A0A401GA33_9APHY|nr:cytochrome P450 [Sparassis crispa]GBE78993.1 cytochrome P450 [Sparassis crispa]
MPTNDCRALQSSKITLHNMRTSSSVLKSVFNPQCDSEMQATLETYLPATVRFSPQAIVALVIAAFLALLYAKKTLAVVSDSGRDAKRPPLVPSGWPWLGNAIQYAYNRIEFVQRARENHGPIFRTTLAGRDATFMTSPSFIAALMRRSQQLSFYPIRGLVHTRTFKMSFDAATSPEVDDQVYPVAFHPYYSKALMGATTAVFGPLLLASLEALIDHSASTFEMRLQDLIFPAFFRCSSRTSFGMGFPADAALPEFLVFDKGFTSLSSGLPTFFFPRYQRARDNLLSIIHTHLEPCLSDGSSTGPDPNLAFEVAIAMRRAGWSREDTVGHLLAFLWGSQGNTMWLTFWCLSYILVDAACIARIRSELHEVLQRDCGGSIKRLVAADPAILEASNFPLLESATKETLRLCSEFIIARVAKEDTIFDVPGQRSYHVPEGGWVFGLPTFVNLDPDVHSAPTEFRMDRFLEDDGHTAPKFYKDGRRVDTNLMFWGGGSHACKGRFVAEYEVKLFIILVISLMDPTPVGVVNCSDGAFVKEPLVPKRTETHIGVLHSDKDLVICCTSQSAQHSQVI